jgi:DNA helicase IV
VCKNVGKYLLLNVNELRNDLNPPKLTEVEERLLQEALEKNDSKVLGDVLSSIVQNQIDLLQSWPRDGGDCKTTRAVFCGHQSGI